MSEQVWANPAALGFAALAAICLLLGMVLTGALAVEDFVYGQIVVGIAGFIAQFATGIILLRMGNTVAGTLFATFGVLFMFAPALSKWLYVTYGATWGHFGAYWDVFLGVLLWCWSPMLLYAPWFEMLIGPLGGLMLVCVGLAHLTGVHGLAVFAGYLFYFFTFWGLWMLMHSLGVPWAKIGTPLLKAPGAAAH